MQREIANLAAHCALQGFRYMAFPPLVFEAVARAVASPEPPAIPERAAPVELAVPEPSATEPRVARLPAKRSAMLDDIAPATRAAAPIERDVSPRRPTPRPIREEPGPAPLVQGTARASRANPPAREKREPSSPRATRDPTPAREKRTTRYALLRDLSDDQS